ncbi:hypothetical protein DFH27DRAFT_528455 [Peziza echinospora]|nr:hypothetical protein DFH27DRAFT_528455 [Peziza echinospora]
MRAPERVGLILVHTVLVICAWACASTEPAPSIAAIAAARSDQTRRQRSDSWLSPTLGVQPIADLLPLRARARPSADARKGLASNQLNDWSAGLPKDSEWNWGWGCTGRWTSGRVCVINEIALRQSLAAAAATACAENVSFQMKGICTVLPYSSRISVSQCFYLQDMPAKFHCQAGRQTSIRVGSAGVFWPFPSPTTEQEATRASDIQAHDTEHAADVEY